jgi:hypothetical protein
VDNLMAQLTVFLCSLVSLDKQIITFCELEQCLLGARVGVLGGVTASNLGTPPPVLIFHRQMSVGIGGVSLSSDQLFQHFLPKRHLGDEAHQMSIVFLRSDHLELLTVIVRFSDLTR